MTKQERNAEIQHNLSLISGICSQLRTDSQRLEESLKSVEVPAEPVKDVEDFKEYLEYITSAEANEYESCFGKKNGENIVLSKTEGEFMLSQLKKFRERLLVVERKLESIGTLLEESE